MFYSKRIYRSGTHNRNKLSVLQSLELYMEKGEKKWQKRRIYRER